MHQQHLFGSLRAACTCESHVTNVQLDDSILSEDCVFVFLRGSEMQYDHAFVSQVGSSCNQCGWHASKILEMFAELLS